MTTTDSTPNRFDALLDSLSFFSASMPDADPFTISDAVGRGWIIPTEGGYKLTVEGRRLAARNRITD